MFLFYMLTLMLNISDLNQQCSVDVRLTLSVLNQQCSVDVILLCGTSPVTFGNFKRVDVILSYKLLILKTQGEAK